MHALNNSAEQLMMLAENKYKSHLLSGEWGNPSDEQAEIVAITAKIDILKKELSNNKKTKDKKKTNKTRIYGEKNQNGLGKTRNQQGTKLQKK